MLHHCDPAVVSNSRWGIFAFFDVLEGHLAEFFGVGINRRTIKGAVKSGVALELAAIAHKLYVDRRRDAVIGSIADVMPDVDFVFATLEGVGLCQLNPILLRVQNQLHAIAAIERAGTWPRTEQ